MDQVQCLSLTYFTQVIVSDVAQRMSAEKPLRRLLFSHSSTHPCCKLSHIDLVLACWSMMCVPVGVGIPCDMRKACGWGVVTRKTNASASIVVLCHLELSLVTDGLRRCMIRPPSRLWWLCFNHVCGCTGPFGGPVSFHRGPLSFGR